VVANEKSRLALPERAVVGYGGLDRDFLRIRKAGSVGFVALFFVGHAVGLRGVDGAGALVEMGNPSVRRSILIDAG
jgi:hypothetical protein